MTNLGDFAQSRGDVMRRLRELEQLVQRMRAERRLEHATVGRGGIRIKGGHLRIEENGDILITGGGGLTVEGGGGVHIGDGGELVVRTPGDLLLQDDAGTTVWQASTAPIRTAHATKDESGLSIPTAWTVLGYDTIPIPGGYLGTSHFILMVSCGDTMSTTGIVSVQPVFRYRYADGSTSAWAAGPAIASADNRIAVATSMWASNFGLDSTVTAVDLGAQCIRVGAEEPNEGNFHVAGSLIFRRG